MADENNESEDGADSERSADSIKKTQFPKQPNKKKFDEDLEELMKQIKIKETTHKTLQGNKEGGGVHQELRAIRAEKEVSLSKRRKIDGSLRSISQAITKKSAALTKVQSNLQYKNEERINDAIRQLEFQLKSTNFRLSEEKKIVAEIDGLKRSKKALGQYLELKKEIEEMRDGQRRMRAERDEFFKTLTSLRQKEEGLKSSTQQNKTSAESIKKEIDELYENKRVMVSEFKALEKEWLSHRDEQRRKQRAEFSRKKEEERRLQAEEYEKDLAEYEASREPFDDERQLCQTLIAYLHRYKASECSLESQDSVSSLQDVSGSEVVPPAEGMYVLRKKSCDDLSWVSGRSNRGRKNRRERRRTLNKPITHSAQIFAQFSQLGLCAPPNVSEVKESINQLENKHCYFGSELLQADLARKPGSEAEADGSAASFTESALSESIPTTPDVQIDNPNFPTATLRRRRLSHDSGACELEDQLVNDSLDDDLCLHGNSVYSLTTEMCELKTEAS